MGSSLVTCPILTHGLILTHQYSLSFDSNNNEKLLIKCSVKLSTKLYGLCISITTRNWIPDFLENRPQIVKIGGKVPSTQDTVIMSSSLTTQPSWVSSEVRTRRATVSGLQAAVNEKIATEDKNLILN